MIGILQNQHLNAKKMADNIEWHWQNISKMLKKRQQDPLVKQIQTDIGSLTFEEIVKADYATLSVYANTLPHSKINACVNSANKHPLIVIYETFRKKYGMEFVERLELTVCPYCNRNYINNGKRNTSAQFDHFFPKSKYPIFALSYYNLIPCCPVCNHIKGDEEVTLVSPYDKITTDRLLHFRFEPNTSSDYAVHIDAIDKRMKSNIDIFDLEALYARHNSLLNELIVKSKIYPQVYRKFLKRLFGSPQVTDMTAEELFFGTYLTEEKYYMRSLSKFTHDIIGQLKDSMPLE